MLHDYEQNVNGAQMDFASIKFPLEQSPFTVLGF